MSELIELITNDGSFSLRSVFFQENFHSIQGALEETKTKFTNPSDLKRFKDKSINVLDICFGIGYNSASLLSDLIKQNSSLNWYALEIDKKPLEYALKNISYLELWHPKVLKIFESLLEKERFEDEFFKCNIIWGEARKKIDAIPPKIKFDLIYLDGFSPQKCPQVWTVEFLSKVIKKLHPQGYLITYSASAAVRMTLRNLGLEIFNIKPIQNSNNIWSHGTVAMAKSDKNLAKKHLFLDKLSCMEEEHLLTKASIPYRDIDLNSKREDILRNRLKEQSLSNLLPTKKWRDKWK